MIDRVAKPDLRTRYNNGGRVPRLRSMSVLGYGSEAWRKAVCEDWEDGPGFGTFEAFRWIGKQMWMLDFWGGSRMLAMKTRVEALLRPGRKNT